MALCITRHTAESALLPQGQTQKMFHTSCNKSTMQPWAYWTWAWARKVQKKPNYAFSCSCFSFPSFPISPSVLHVSSRGVSIMPIDSTRSMYRLYRKKVRASTHALPLWGAHHAPCKVMPERSVSSLVFAVTLLLKFNACSLTVHCRMKMTFGPPGNALAVCRTSHIYSLKSRNASSKNDLISLQFRNAVGERKCEYVFMCYCLDLL